MNRKVLLPILGLVILIVTVAQVRALSVSRNPQNSTPAAKPVETPAISAEGRVVTYPGAEVIVGADAAGIIERLLVAEKDKVRKGQTIAVLRADDTRAALSQARSRVGEADADIRLYETEAARTKKLFDEEVGSKETWDRSVRDLEAARARRASAIAEVERLEATLAKTNVVSPIDGVVIARDVQQGEHLATGDAIVTIANLDRTRVEAEVDEFDASRVVLGDSVAIKAEGYDGKSWRGTIEEIPDSVVSRRIKPADPSKPIDTRVLLVKVAMNEPTPLKLGQRVEVEVRKR